MAAEGATAEFVEQASELRARASRLQAIVDQINQAADTLEAEVTGHRAAILRGRDIVDELLRHVAPGEEIHYRDAHQRLLAAGFTAGGKVPVNTLLAQINRSPEFVHVRSRSGLYLRKEPADA